MLAGEVRGGLAVKVCALRRRRDCSGRSTASTAGSLVVLQRQLWPLLATQQGDGGLRRLPLLRLERSQQEVQALQRPLQGAVRIAWCHQLVGLTQRPLANGDARGLAGRLLRGVGALVQDIWQLAGNAVR